MGRVRLVAGVLGVVFVVSLRRLLKGRKHPAWSWRMEWLAETVRHVVLRAGLDAVAGNRGSGSKQQHQQATPERELRGGIRWRRAEMAGLRCEIHTPPDWNEQQPTVLYLHGGGYVALSPATHRDLVARIAKASGARCVVPNYRKAPKHPFPAAIEDALACYRALVDEGVNPERLVVGGDSAGGGLSLALMLRLREQGEPLPRAAFLLSPWVDLEFTGTSIDTNAPYDYLSRARLEEASGHYLAGHDRRDPLVSAVFADLGGLPPLLVQTGDAELFYDENCRLVERARAAQVPVTHEVAPGMIHVYPVFAPVLEQARQAIATIGDFVRIQAGFMEPPKTPSAPTGKI